MLSGTLPADLLAPPRATNWVEAVLYGALARGCNVRIVVVVQAREGGGEGWVATGQPRMP